MNQDTRNNYSQSTLLKDGNLYIIFGITLMAVMGVASITPAFPEIIKYFEISKKQVAYLITVFTLPGIFLAPLMGMLADRLGRKAIIVPSLFVFAIAGFACSFAESFNTLLILRFFQGAGMASLGMLNTTMVGDLYSGNKRSTAMGYVSGILSIGTATYPAIGGLLADIAWNVPFYLPLLAIPVGFAVIFGLKNPEPDKNPDFKDYLRKTWKSINKKPVWGLFLNTLLMFIILYGAYLSFFPLLLEADFGASSSKIGLTMSIMSLTTAIVSTQTGRLKKIFSHKQLLFLSISAYMIAMVVIPLSYHYWSIILGIVIFGCGHGLMIPNFQTMLVSYATINERAAFMSVNAMVLRIGQTVGPLLIGVCYSMGDLRTSFFGGAAIAVIMFVVLLFIIQEPPKSK
jgi:MFS transporter, ACDE family, multidrug resistance protein